MVNKVPTRLTFRARECKIGLISKNEGKLPAISNLLFYPSAPGRLLLAVSIRPLNTVIGEICEMCGEERKSDLLPSAVSPPLGFGLDLNFYFSPVRQP